MLNNIMRFILMFLLLNNSLGLNINSRRDIFTGLIHSLLLFNKNDVSKDFDFSLALKTKILTSYLRNFFLKRLINFFGTFLSKIRAIFLVLGHKDLIFLG